MADPAASRAGPAVFFLHLPKTGGVSFQAALAQGMAGGRQLVGLTSTIDLPKDFTSLAAFDPVAGHQPWPLRRFLRWPRRTVSLFRNPWERAPSAYRHLLRDTEHAVATLGFVATTEELDHDGPRCLAGLLGVPPPPLPHLNPAPEGQQVALTDAEGHSLRWALRYDWVVWEAVRRRVGQERQAAGRSRAAGAAA